jgi:hypothetical protein
MDRPFQRQVQRRGGRRAAALENVNAKGVACGLQRKAQRRRRSRLRGLQGTKERDPGAAGLGGNGQAPQLLVARAGKPGKQRMAASGAQHLLGGP